MDLSLDSSSNHTFLTGSIVCNYVWDKKKEIQRYIDRSLKMKFNVFFHNLYNTLVCQFTTLAKDSRHTWSVFGTNSSQNHM